jgi:hypothetical protein
LSHTGFSPSPPPGREGRGEAVNILDLEIPSPRLGGVRELFQFGERFQTGYAHLNFRFGIIFSNGISHFAV